MAVRMMIDKHFFHRLLPFLSIHYYADSMFISLQRKAMLIQNHGMRSHYYTADGFAWRHNSKNIETSSHSSRHVTPGVNSGSWLIKI
jgi:hypothetical protein